MVSGYRAAVAYGHQKIAAADHAGRAGIVIAHPLSTIRDSGVIVVRDHGRIVESGGHEELLRTKVS